MNTFERNFSYDTTKYTQSTIIVLIIIVLKVLKILCTYLNWAQYASLTFSEDKFKEAESN